MAIVSKYFGISSVGAGDATSYSDRQALLQRSITVNSGTWSAAFTVGETATQTGTSATGKVVFTGGSGSTFVVSDITGSPNNSGVWTGGTSGSTVTPTTTPAAAIWPTEITSFAFNGSDALQCILEPGIYKDLAVNLSFANPPNQTKQLFFRTYNFVPPRWISPEPEYSRSNMARLQSATAFSIGLAWINWFGICLEFSNRNSTLLSNVTQFFDWCILENSTNGTSACVASGSGSSIFSNCVLKSTGTSFLSVLSWNNGWLINSRLEGNPSASSGNRRCIETSFTPPVQYLTTLINCPGGGVYQTAATGNTSASITRCTMYNIGSGVYNGSSNSTAMSTIIDNFIVGIGDGVQTPSTSLSRIHNNRLRVDGTPVINQIDFPSELNYTSSGNNSDEFVDSGAGDYRIKKNSDYWGKGLGAGDELDDGWGFQRRSRTIGI